MAARGGDRFTRLALGKVVKAGWWLSALLLPLLAIPAQAQDVPPVISPLRVEPDHNGVNLVDGRITITGPTLSVPAAPNLTFDRIQNAAPYYVGSQNSGDPFTASWSVHTGGGSSESFTCVEIDCTSVTYSGSTFAANQYRQAGSGAVWYFTQVHYNKVIGQTTYKQRYASSVVYPNGETIGYTYQTYNSGDAWGRVYHRPILITSNLGYSISITYQGNTFGTFEWGTPSVVTLYKTSDPATPLGRLTYSGNTITDLGGRVYTCTGCNNTLGLDLEVPEGSLQLPGEASPAIQVTRHPTIPVVTSVVKDGVTWSYSYANLRSGNSGYGYVYDSLTVDGPNGYHVIYRTTGSNIRNVINRYTDPIARVTDFSHDIGYRPTNMVLPELNQVTVGYDSYGNIFTQTVTPKPSSGLSAVTETASFPVDTCFTGGTPVLCYRPTWSRDGLNRQTDYLYNSLGQLTEQTDPADQNGTRRKTYVTYDASTGLSRRSVVRICGYGGTAPTCGTTSEIRTEYQYWGNTFLPSLERRIDAATGVTLDTTYTYDAAGRLVTTDGPLAGSDDKTYFQYDLYGRKTWEIGGLTPQGLHLAKRYTYRNADDQVTSIEEGTVADPVVANPVLTVLNRTDLTYDGHRNPIRAAVSAGGSTYTVTDKSYDDRGRLECTAVRMNPAVFGSLPASACTLGTAGSYGSDRIVKNLYDAAGQLLQVREGVGTSVEAAEVTNTYTSNGKLKYVIDAGGHRAELRYDGHDRQSRWVFPSTTNPPAFNDSTPANAVATAGALNEGDYELYGYDLIGNRTSFRKRDGSTLTYQYDALNRMTVKVVPERSGLYAAHTRDVYYGYDLRNLMTYARFDSTSGEGVTFGYDGFGRKTSETIAMDGASRALGSQYDAGGNRTRLTWPDGNYVNYVRLAGAGQLNYTSLNGTSMLFHPAYDTAGRVEEMYRWSTAAGAWSQGTDLRYDALSRLTYLGHYFAPSGYDGATTFSYNPASQIASLTRSNDVYAWGGQVGVSRAYVANGLNQYSAVGGTSFAYDANGNLTFDGTQTYVYDVENRLVQRNGGGTVTYVRYDPLGRIHELSPSATVLTQFLYDGDALVAEYGGSGTVTARHVHGDGAGDDPLVRFEGPGVTDSARRYLYADERGSIVALTEASGNVTAVNSYDEYGIPAAGNQGRFQYTGQAYLFELGMYYYKARMYSPTLGRFLQTDPIGYEGGLNIYAYVGNDPVNRGDPTGTFATGGDCSTGSRLPGGAVNCMSEIVNAPAENARGRRNATPATSAEGNGDGDSEGEGILERGKTASNELIDRVVTSNELGRHGEDVVRERLEREGYTIVATGLYMWTSDGHLRIADIVVEKDGKITLVEVKVNGGRYSSYQRTMDGRIKSEGAYVNPNSPAAEEVFGPITDARYPWIGPTKTKVVRVSCPFLAWSCR